MKTNIADVMLQNMEHCPGAVSAFRKNLKDGADKAAVAKAAKAVDSYLAIEDKAKKSGATEADVQKMKGLIDNAKSVISKAGLEGHTYHDMHLAKVKKMMKEDIQSADKKPEKYIGPDGKTKIRMVPVDRQVVKKEANMDEISLKDLQKKITSTGMASTKRAGNMDKTKNDLAALRKRLSGLTPVKEAVEDDEPASPDEAGMAMDQAKFIGYVAEEIMEYIQGNNEFPEWMQNKLSALHEKAKGMHAVMAGKYNESAEVNEAMDETYWSVNEMGPRHTSKSMKSRFGGAVDSKKFDAYKKFVKKRNVDEPTVRMVIDNPNDAESKRMMKNANIAKAVELRKAAMKEETVNLEELTAAEKKLVNQMYDKKGNLTPLGKKVMNHGKKPGDRGYTESLDEVLDRPGALDSYRKKAKMKSDKARNTATAKLLRGNPDISKEKETIRKREKGQGMADRVAVKQFRKSIDRGYVAKKEETVDEARRKGAPKITGDFVAIQRAKDAELNKALGRTKTGRKKPVRTPTSTQRSLAQLRGDKK